MLAGVWHVSYTGNGHVKLLITMRDITLDDIFIHREEAKIPCNLTASKNTHASLDLVWQTASTKEMFLI